MLMRALGIVAAATDSLSTSYQMCVDRIGVIR
jgi:hypothetical protein